VLDDVGPQSGGDTAPLRDWRTDTRVRVSHIGIILHIWQQCVRTELTEGYQR
jgi:hypothetical protein